MITFGHIHNPMEKEHIHKYWEWWRMWPGGSALQMRCFMQDYLGSRPQLERGALGSAVIAGGVKMKFAVWFCGDRSMAKGALEDRLAHLLICWRLTLGSPETACRLWWITRLAGEREPWGVDWGRPSSSRINWWTRGWTGVPKENHWQSPKKCHILKPQNWSSDHRLKPAFRHWCQALAGKTYMVYSQFQHQCTYLVFSCI